MNLSAIGIACKDINSTISFYELFDLSFEELGDGHFEAITKSGLRIMLDSFELLKKINPKWTSPKSSGITLCFEQENATNVNNLYQKIITAGSPSVVEPWDAFWQQRYASVLDPDGNQVDIFSPL